MRDKRWYLVKSSHGDLNSGSNAAVLYENPASHLSHSAGDNIAFIENILMRKLFLMNKDLMFKYSYFAWIPILAVLLIKLRYDVQIFIFCPFLSMPNSGCFVYWGGGGGVE